MLPQLPDLGDWHKDAVCLPNEAGERWALPTVMGGRWDQERAKKTLCAWCPVHEECLADALAFRSVFGLQPDGVWGGLGKVERERLWLARRAEESEAA